MPQGLPPRTRPQPRPPADRRGVEDIDDSGHLLHKGLELALARARRDAGTPDAPPPPASLRPVLRFNRLPAKALKTVKAALDRDEGFRRRVVDGVSEDDLDRPSWLFLTRPEGWEEELELLEAAALAEREDERASREEQSAQRRAEQLTDTVQRLRDEVAELNAALAEAERATAEERTARLGAERERAELSDRFESLRVERAAAVKSLKQTEATAVARLEELREVRGQLAAALEERSDTTDVVDTAPAPSSPLPPAPPVPEPSPWQGTDPRSVADAVQRASAAAGALAAALDEVVGSLRPPEPEAGPPGSGAATPAPADQGPSTTPRRSAEPAGGPHRPPRRTPVRLRRGVHENSVEGLEQLLGTPGAIVIVDGYNVTKQGWPMLEPTEQRASLLTALGAVSARTGANLHVVFDGDAEGGRPAVTAPLPVRVHFSPADVEADDVILAMVAELPTDVPVVVVSSDRRVADGARRLGANSVRSEQLLGLVRR